jgi:hypothetical protein
MWWWEGKRRWWEGVGWGGGWGRGGHACTRAPPCAAPAPPSMRHACARAWEARRGLGRAKSGTSHLTELTLLTLGDEVGYNPITLHNPT